MFTDKIQVDIKKKLLGQGGTSSEVKKLKITVEQVKAELKKVGLAELPSDNSIRFLMACGEKLRIQNSPESVKNFPVVWGRP